MDYVAHVTVAVAGVLLPAFSTHKALQIKTQQTRLIWLRYWVVFAFYYVFKVVADLIMSWLPFYHLVQILLILWLSSAKAGGAQIIYSYAVVPILREREQAIDRLITRHKKHAAVLFWQAASAVTSRWSATVFRLIRLYFEASLSDADIRIVAPAVPVTSADASLNDAERQAIHTDLPVDEDMLSDDDNEQQEAAGEKMVIDHPVTPSRRKSRRRASVKADCNFNVAGDD